MKDQVDIEVQKLHHKVKVLLQEGCNEDRIVTELRKEGIDAAYVKILIGNIEADRQKRRNFWKLLFMGSFFLIGGLALNYFSYRIAVQQDSSVFLLFWGIVVTGITILIRAFYLYRN